MITFIKRLAILLLIQGVFFDFAHADGSQDLKNLYNSYLPNFQKLTPEASALGQYGKYGVSSYTGAPDISVPLFTIGSGSFSMPVELKYDASGIKVEQEATYVGLGWNLIMGGSITHIVCGQNDFEETISGDITNHDLLNLVEGNKAQEYISRAYLNPFLKADRISENKKWRMLEEVYSGRRIPDIYQASFCGHNVSFVIVNDSARIIDNNATKYKIKIKAVNSTEKSIEITDDHGIRYVFVQAQLAYVGDNRLFNLSKICNAAECLAEFKYTTGSFLLKKHYYESVGKTDMNYNRPIPDDIQMQFIRHNSPEHNTLFEYINKSYPETIKTNREIITFTYSDRRTDIKGAKQIDAITVKSRIDNSIIHTVAFKYGYFTERDIDTELCGNYGYSNNYSYTRLKLADVTIDGKKYSFEYNNENDLPARLSRAQDFWGYYNGAQNSDGLCASPQYRLFAGNISELNSVGTAYRFASLSKCKVGTLNKIVYPTGGYTKFDYEVHHFNDENGRLYYPANESLSRIRPRASEGIGDVAGQAGTDYSKGTVGKNGEKYSKSIKIYIPHETDAYMTYKVHVKNQDLSARVLLHDDSLHQTLFEEYTTTNRKDIWENNKKIHLHKGNYTLTETVSHKDNDYETVANINITYYLPPKVDESIIDGGNYSVGAGLRIRTIENYDSDSKLIERTRYKYEDGKLLLPTVNLNHIQLWYGFMVSGFTVQATGAYDNYRDCAFYFVTSDSSSPEICSLGSPNVGYSKVIKERYNRDNQLISYDVETYNNKGYSEIYNEANLFHVNRDGLNGKIISSTTYSDKDIPMHRTIYGYTVLDMPSKIEDVVFFPWCRRDFPKPDGLTTLLKYRYSLYPKYITNVLPSEVTEINYVNGTAMKLVTTSFHYNPTNYQLSDQSVTDGTNTSRTLYSYPASNTLRFMQHNLSEVDGVETYRNGTFTGGSKYIFKVHKNPQTGASFSVVEKCYSILPDAKKSKVIEMSVTSYDDYGNIREYQKKDGTPVTIIWSYNHQHPIMEIVGKTYDQVKTAYSSITSLENKPSVAETTMSSIHATLRKNLPDALVTAYTYSPWHTVSEIIQPNGNKTKYAYDSYGRLEETKDINDKTLQKYSYNYKNK